MLIVLCFCVLIYSEGASFAEEPPSEAEIGSIQVYLTPEQGRTRMFPEGVRFEREIKHIPVSLKVELEQNLGRRFTEDKLEVFIVYDKADELLGYAMVSEEIGKYRPITFMVGIGPDFRVKNAAILIYRESRGGEVRRSRFLRQYFGKSPEDPISINRDIINITGATLSVRALNFGIKKLLVLAKALYETPSKEQETVLIRR